MYVFGSFFRVRQVREKLGKGATKNDDIIIERGIPSKVFLTLL